jgi:hypothetical protein
MSGAFLQINRIFNLRISVDMGIEGFVAGSDQVK